MDIWFLLQGDSIISGHISAQEALKDMYLSNHIQFEDNSSTSVFVLMSTIHQYSTWWPTMKNEWARDLNIIRARGTKKVQTPVSPQPHTVRKWHHNQSLCLDKMYNSFGSWMKMTKIEWVRHQKPLSKNHSNTYISATTSSFESIWVWVALSSVDLSTNI